MADGIFTDDEIKADKATADTPIEETEQQKAERERDEQGRFKAKEGADPAPSDNGGDEGEDGERTVPHGAFHAEREKRKASDEKAKTLEAELAPLKAQLEALAKMREQIASRAPEALPAADDPAAVEHLRTRLAEIEQGQTRITQHLDTQAVNAEEMQKLGAVMHQSEQRYRQEKPDYDAAIEHVVKARAQELALYGLTPPQIQHAISEEATDIVRSAVAQGRDPAELGYQIAVSRGYRAAAPDETNKDMTGVSPAQRTLDAIEEARKQGKSLGGGGGSKPASLNAEAVKAMTDDEFEAIYSTPEGKAMIDNL